MMAYLISYSYKKNQNEHGYGNLKLTCTLELSTEDVEKIEKDIKERNDFEAVIILNVVKLRG